MFRRVVLACGFGRFQSRAAHWRTDDDIIEKIRIKIALVSLPVPLTGFTQLLSTNITSSLSSLGAAVHAARSMRSRRPRLGSWRDWPGSLAYASAQLLSLVGFG